MTTNFTIRTLLPTTLTLLDNVTFNQSENVVDANVTVTLMTRNVDVDCNSHVDPTLKNAWILYMTDIILMVVSLIGCLLLLCLVSRDSWNVRTPTNVLITSYLISDILMSSLVIPLHMMLITSSGNPCLNVHACKFYQYGSSTLSMAAIYTVFLIMFDSFYGLTFSVKQTFKENFCTFSLSFVWFFALAYSIWTVVLYSPSILSSDINSTISQCGFAVTFTGYGLIYAIIDIMVMLVIPDLMIVVVFVFIFSILKGTKTSSELLETVRIGAILTMIYTVTYLPRTVIQISDATNVILAIFGDRSVVYALEMCQFLRAPLNFIAFVITRRDIRDSLLQRNTYRTSSTQSWLSCSYTGDDDAEEDGVNGYSQIASVEVHLLDTSLDTTL